MEQGRRSAESVRGSMRRGVPDQARIHHPDRLYESTRMTSSPLRDAAATCWYAGRIRARSGALRRKGRLRHRLREVARNAGLAMDEAGFRMTFALAWLTQAAPLSLGRLMISIMFVIGVAWHKISREAPAANIIGWTISRSLIAAVSTLSQSRAAASAISTKAAPGSRI